MHILKMSENDIMRKEKHSTHFFGLKDVHILLWWECKQNLKHQLNSKIAE